MKVKYRLLTVMGLFAFTIPSLSYAQKICVFDPAGTQGDSYSLMKDYSLAAKQWGADITLKAYVSDQKATDDFKDGKCDGLSSIGYRIRQFNTFTGSIDSFGQIPSDSIARSVLGLMANPKLASEMVSGDNEIVGVSAFGMLYTITNDRSINTMAKMMGKRFGVLDFDSTHKETVQKLGGIPVGTSLSSIGTLFNAGKLDLIFLPAYAYRALDIEKGMGTHGAIAKYPVAFITMQIVIRRDKFPEGYGPKSRTWIAAQLDRQFRNNKRIEDSIDPRLWEDLPDTDKKGYDRILREVRIGFQRKGIYSKRMASITKKARCMKAPTNYECTQNDE